MTQHSDPSTAAQADTPKEIGTELAQHTANPSAAAIDQEQVTVSPLENSRLLSPLSPEIAEVALLINHQRQRWLEPPLVSQERRKLLLMTDTPLLDKLGQAPLPTAYGDWTYIVYGDRSTGAHVAVLVYGDLDQLTANNSLSQPLIVRVHSSNSVTELFLARGCGDCQKLENSMKAIHEDGKPAAIIFLDHDGRGNGMQGLLGDLNRLYCWSPEGQIISRGESPGSTELDSEVGPRSQDKRDYHAARRILKELGITDPLVPTTNFEKLRQLHSSYQEVHSGCPEDERPFRLLEVQKLLIEQNLEWKQLWMSIEKNKRLLLGAKHSPIEKIGHAPLPTEYGDWTIVAYGDYTSGEVHLALVYGELQDTLDSEHTYPVRVHSSCQTNERLHAINCECRAELHETMRQIQAEGRGVIIYLQQEGRGTGVFGKLHQLGAMFKWEGNSIKQQTTEDGRKVTTTTAYKMHNFPEEIRDFTVGALMLKDIGVKKVIAYSNNGRKAAALEEHGIAVVGHRALIFPELVASNEVLRHDLKDKRDTLGHHGLNEYSNLDH